MCLLSLKREGTRRMIEVKFKTRCTVDLDRDLREHEIHALLDWCFGELTTDQTERYGNVTEYPKGILEAAANVTTK